MTLPLVKADSVRAEVNSLSTCTSATATALADLLSPGAYNLALEDDIRSEPPSDRRTVSKVRTARVPKPGSANLGGSKDDGYGRARLSPKEKAILATEVINATLKALTSSSKTAPSTQRQPSTSEATRSPRRKALRRSSSLPQSPLQQRSLNRVSSSPNIGSRSSRSSSSASITSSNYRAMAECSRTAFACMRSLQTSRTPCMMDISPFQLENGMSALISRLLSLGIDDLALKELRILKKRLEGAISSEKPGRNKIAGINSSKTSGKAGVNQTLIDLIDFEISPSGSTGLFLTITTQLQVLKLVASSRDPSQIAATLPKLRIDDQRSPISLLLQFANESPGQTTKAARQLEILSQLILSMCPNISSLTDMVATAPKTSISPAVALELQVLAFQSRLLWWNLCNHQGDLETEVLTPFSKCLAAFTRRSKCDALETYRMASGAFRTIQDRTPNHMLGGSKPSISSISRVLGSLAQDASCLDDAIKWLLEAKANCGPGSELQSCSTAASLLSLKLLTSAPDVEIEELLLVVLEGLEGPLKGESLELDELLSEVSKVRRAAISLLHRQSPVPITTTTPKISAGVRQMCESLVLLCPRFSIRYLGKQPEPSSAPKIIVRHEQRRQFLAKSAFHAIDSSIFLLKTFQSEKRLTWELMDSTLQDCLRLLERIGDKFLQPASESTRATASYYVRISHLYFTQHLNMRRDAEERKDLLYLRPLRRSIDCISARSSAEKIASLMNSKLERLADLYKMVGRHDDARETLLRLHGELLKCGTLSNVAAAGCTKPLIEAWQETEDVSTLARVIASLAKLELKSGSKLLAMPLYDLSWPDTEKGLILEHILDILSRQPRESKILQRNLFLELLSIYELQKFPVRRLRIMSRHLGLDPDQRRSLIDDVKNTLAVSRLGVVLENSEDSGLLSYLPHLQALTSSVLELQEDHPRVDLLRPQLASWSSALETCKNTEALARIVDDVPNLLSHLLSMADFLHMKGISKLRSGVLRMIANLYQMPQSDSCPDDLVLSQTYLGLQYLELGYSGRAALSLDKAQSYASCNGVTPEALLQMHLARAEHSLADGHTDRCEEILLRAQALTLHNPDLLTASKSSGNLIQRTRLTTLAAHTFLVHSLLSLQRGAPAIALAHAKRSVKLIRYSWAKIAVHMKSKAGVSGTTAIDSLADDVLKLNLSNNTSPVMSTTFDYPPGPSAWALVNPLFRSLLNLSALYAYQGMFQETTYYAEQAHNLVKLVDSGTYLATALTTAGTNWLAAGHLDKASEFLVMAKEYSISSGDNQTAATLGLQLGKMQRQLDNRDAEIAAYDFALTTLDTLSSVKYIVEIDQINDSAIALEEMSRMTIKVRQPKGSRKAATVRKIATKKVAATTKNQAAATPSVPDECRRLGSLKSSLLRQKAGAFMLWKRCEDAVVALTEAESFSRTVEDSIDQHIGMAKLLFLESLEQMSSHPVYSVLQDSTISFPAVITSSKTAGSASERQVGMRLSPPRKNPANTSARAGHRSKGAPSASCFEMLHQAHEHLREAHSTAAQLSSTAVIHSLSSLICAVSTFISASGQSLGNASSHPNFATCFMEMSRNISLDREHKAILNDPSSSQKENELQWPVIGIPDEGRRGNESKTDTMHFQKEYIDIIPEAWTAVSISLSESRQELCFTKMQSGNNPFVLRLPLGRNNSRDVDEEVFDFDQGKTELLEIIELANDNSHGAKDLTGREAKNAWWAERAELDMRLKELLENIETVWLGGFRGIFSQHKARPDLLARFQKSFQNILENHLPSRQKGSKRGKSTRITLDTRVLELFIGLGQADSEDCDLDEALTDLLYFVVDILQFHGERNAYDEIDFDSIVIETHDALRSYHEAVGATSTTSEHTHTILILDKALHAFPWESLPCMDGMAVSRLPSLDCLRNRILEQPDSSPPNGIQGRYVSRVSGSYVLNPGGDLKTTQSTFESELQNLNSWTGITKREPTELEMQESLESKDIFLYFGHGSGAQYIRSKAIKRLKNCAVTMLMGCSSGALTEAGEFEPYGPPIDYMLGGSPALVATLWDVTDKDIDRFAKSTFEHWGLFGAQPTRNERSMKGSSKRKAQQPLINEDAKSLVKAVAEGRKACNFRYLTAAAVCVYGIPVYLR